MPPGQLPPRRLALRAVEWREAPSVDTVWKALRPWALAHCCNTVGELSGARSDRGAAR